MKKTILVFLSGPVGRLTALLFSACSFSAWASDNLPVRMPVRPSGTNAAIPWSEIGARATAQSSGEGLAVLAGTDGTIQLHCAFQRLEGQVGSDGLWLSSTVPGQKASRFHVTANSLGREGGAMITLPESGATSLESGQARYLRKGLVEEYSVSVDGVRQDFIIPERMPGGSKLRVALSVSGARLEPLNGGAQLVLDGSGRKLAYSRLRAVDATGKELDAQIKVAGLKLLAVVVQDATAVYPIRIDPTFSDANWISFGEVPGVDGQVYAAVVDDAGNLYLGGTFTTATAGGVPANYIAQWNGSSWSALGSGMNNWVNALAVSGNTLYAGGYFGTAGGVAANCIAQWNGSSWSALGSGMNSEVEALAVSGNNLYAGGYFTTSGDGSQTLNYIAQWNGSSWSGLGPGMNSDVEALAVSGSNLYAGGWFTTATGVPANYIAQWNGSSWSGLGSGMNSEVEALAVSGNNLFVGDDFTTAGGKLSAYVARATLPFAIVTTSIHNDQLTICWTSAPGVDYNVYTTSSLAPPQTWTQVNSGPIPAATGQTTCYTLPQIVSDQQQLFVTVVQEN
jgi:hypothetical protein